MRKLGGNLADDPDLTNFQDMLLPTDVGGVDRVDACTGPSQERSHDEDGEPVRKRGKPRRDDASDDWSGLDPDPKPSWQVLGGQQEDPDEGIDWDDDQAQDAQEDER